MNPISAEPEGEWLRRLLDVGLTVTSELDERVVLEGVLETARQMTGARYAALGVLNDQRDGLARFLTAGIDDQGRQAIGSPPRGLGVLGVLISDPSPLRLDDVGEHPSSYGFPPGHPEMRSFLGVPVVIRGEVWGNLYLTEKDGGEFTWRDEKAAMILAAWAAVAIENSRIYEASELRRVQAEKRARDLEATRDIAVAVAEHSEADRVLELIAQQGCNLVEAKGVLIWLREHERLTLAATAGEVGGDWQGLSIPIAGTLSGEVLESGRAKRIVDLSSDRSGGVRESGVVGTDPALLVPMIYRGQAVGLLAACDGERHKAGYSEEDQRLLESFAASAATAVALARRVEADRLRAALAASEAERTRWARELHDETLQSMAGLRLRLSAALRSDDSEQTRAALRAELESISKEIDGLRTLITELRPAALDDIGLQSAIEALLNRHREHSRMTVTSELSLQPRKRHGDPELESNAYRLIQEALTNVEKHSGAHTVRVTVEEAETAMTIRVADDGEGFDPDRRSDGFGLIGMRERVAMLGGSLAIDSNEHGTSLTALLPNGRASGTARIPDRN